MPPLVVPVTLLSSTFLKAASTTISGTEQSSMNTVAAHAASFATPTDSTRSYPNQLHWQRRPRVLSYAAALSNHAKEKPMDSSLYPFFHPTSPGAVVARQRESCHPAAALTALANGSLQAASAHRGGMPLASLETGPGVRRVAWILSVAAVLPADPRTKQPSQDLKPPAGESMRETALGQRAGARHPGHSRPRHCHLQQRWYGSSELHRRHVPSRLLGASPRQVDGQQRQVVVICCISFELHAADAFQRQVERILRRTLLLPGCRSSAAGPDARPSLVLARIQARVTANSFRCFGDGDNSFQSPKAERIRCRALPSERHGNASAVQRLPVSPPVSHQHNSSKSRWRSSLPLAASAGPSSPTAIVQFALSPTRHLHHHLRQNELPRLVRRHRRRPRRRHLRHHVHHDPADRRVRGAREHPLGLVLQPVRDGLWLLDADGHRAAHDGAVHQDVRVDGVQHDDHQDRVAEPARLRADGAHERPGAQRVLVRERLLGHVRVAVSGLVRVNCRVQHLSVGCGISTGPPTKYAASASG
ncbi:hypothetical protein PHYPSEUDO_001080 [Phytophthora pseudosyringae]|uniref:Uncharacterized protein n=1 Tax=Phytophthora pseudosyringae TaxID=221518 RepID=A0A8T1V5Z2_9STRA|nr:hypothetical protein PHYPSEUDO_001080 [Phytophthora pseudosyringae]